MSYDVFVTKSPGLIGQICSFASKTSEKFLLGSKKRNAANSSNELDELSIF